MTPMALIGTLKPRPTLAEEQLRAAKAYCVAVNVETGVAENRLLHLPLSHRQGQLTPMNAVAVKSRVASTYGLVAGGQWR